MRFKRSVQRYGRTPAPETPFARAGQLWDERIGSARVQARNWRLMALGSLALSMGLAAALVWQARQSRVLPYVVEVDRLGEAHGVAPAATDYKPTDPQIAWHLGRFIKNVRSRSLDPVLMRENWLSAYDYATGHAAQFLSDYARRDDPFSDIGQHTVSVQVTSIVRASDKSFQIKWIERRYERGALAATSHWTAMATVTLRAPRNAETLRRNPLGLYIAAIDWSRELDGPGEREASAAVETRSLPSNIPMGSPLDPPANPLPSTERPLP